MVMRVEAPAGEPKITRRSGWPRLLQVIAVLCVVAGMGTCTSSYSPGNPSSGLIFFACGLVAAIQLFLFAFLVDVFTDIRWFLKKLVEEKVSTAAESQRDDSFEDRQEKVEGPKGEIVKYGQKGLWKCTGCGALSYPDSIKCYQCGGPKEKLAERESLGPQAG
jgi:hypothetical protein